MESGCQSCGYENRLGARFCSSCGSPLKARVPTDETVADASTASMEAAPEPIGVDDLPDGTTAMFVVRHGPKRGSRIALDSEEISIGRHPESDIFLDDVTVSRRHASVRKVGASFHVFDAGSLNGTYVNQSRVETAALNDGDEVQVGKFKLVYLDLTGLA